MHTKAAREMTVVALRTAGEKVAGALKEII
jgi:hypothetical protein